MSLGFQFSLVLIQNDSTSALQQSFTYLLPVSTKARNSFEHENPTHFK